MNQQEALDHAKKMPDNVNNPKHYTNHPSGVECITVTEHMNFCLGNAMKYLWRADLKNGVEDLEKARWYIDREIERRQGDDVAQSPKPNLAENEQISDENIRMPSRGF